MRMMRAGTPRRRQGLLAQPCDARSLRSIVVTHWLKSGAVIRRGVWTLEKRCAATSAARCCSLLRMPKEAFPKFFPAARLQVRFRSSREHVYETASLDTGMDPRTTNVHAGLPRDLWDPGATRAVKLMRERKGYDSQQAVTDKCWREDSQNESCYGGEPVQDTRAPNICARAFGFLYVVLMYMHMYMYICICNNLGTFGAFVAKIEIPRTGLRPQSPV